MSIADATTKIIYAGDGHTTVFDITFALPYGSTGTDVKVYVVDDEGTVTELTSNYTVDVNALTVTYPTVAGVAPLESGVAAVPVNWELVLVRVEPLSQTLQLTNQGVFDAPSIERAFDKIVMMCQQLQEQVNRCHKAPINLPDNIVSPVIPPDVATLTYTTDTLANLVIISDASPTVARFAVASDVGDGQLVFYPGYASTNGIQGTGWYAIGGGV